MEKESKSLINNDCMVTIKTFIESSSSSNCKIDKILYNTEDWKVGTYLIEKFKKKKVSEDEIIAIIFDKTIFSLIGRQKMKNQDYLYLFYILFEHKNYRDFVKGLNYKYYSKFLRKFFNACMKTHLLELYEIAGFIEFYSISLYRIITKSPDENKIEILLEKPIADLKTFDREDIQFIKLLVKYCLAFCNILGYSQVYKMYYKNVFDYMEVIEDVIFKKIFRKQLNKLFLNKGIYSYGKKFVTFFFNQFIDLYDKTDVYEYSKLSSFYIYTILHYQPKYLKNESNKFTLYNEGSPFFFLNMPILINILNDMNVEEEKMHLLIIKLIESHQEKFNLFIDDNSKLRVAEYMLIDELNNKIILNHLSKIILAKHYFKNEHISKNLNTDKNNDYFDYLFYDLCLDKFIENYKNGSQNYNTKTGNFNNNSNLNHTFSSQSQDMDDYFSIINSKIILEKDYINLIINKFLTCKDYFINKYLNKNNDIDIDEINEEVEKKENDILSKKSIEELFLLLDIIYSFSKRFHDEKLIEKCILDIHKIIIIIIQKSFDEIKFNCVIFDFIITVDKKYLPSSESEFDIARCIEILSNKSSFEFIRTYPLHLIFILNYFPKNNLDIPLFYSAIKNFTTGYLENVFRSIDENMEQYNHTLQINYLSIIYFIIEEILTIYISINKNNNNEINKQIIQYLPYCLNCQKKMKFPLILSDHLSQCTYCGEILLYINTNLYDYLIKDITKFKIFFDEWVFNVITKVTCNILNGFYSKYENRNNIKLHRYNLYYKIMYQHFEFLRMIKSLIGQKIPFVVESNCNINNIEGALEENIKNFFEKYITEKSKYPYRYILQTIKYDKFLIFNSIRKTIKHERELAKNKYII